MFGKKQEGIPANTRTQGSTSSENTRILAVIAQDYLKERKSRRRWGLFFKLLVLVYVSASLVIYFSDPDQGVSVSHTAVVEIDGIIGPGEISASKINKSIKSAFEAGASRAVILMINSPGGTPVQAAMINEEVIRLKGLYPDKPVYAAISDMCASGGYYIAVAADEIYAHPSSIVGSIGVLMNGFGFVETLKKLGVERRLLTAGKNKSMLDPFSPVNFSQQNHAKKMLDDVHQQFIAAVKTGRGDRISDDPDIYSGLFWSGEEAKELGLVDKFGSAQYIAREVVGENRMVDYTIRPKFIDAFAAQLGASISNTFLKLNMSMQ
jgi:protease-4